jgi:hypothetical protein
MSELAEGLGHRRSHAVVVGVEHYDHAQLPDLPGARAAAARLATVLAEVSSPSPIDVRRQLNPTRAELVRAVTEACDEASERLILYFAGHGVTSPDGELVLAGRDCDPRHPELTGVTWESLTRELAHAAAPSLLVILDACGIDSDGERVWQVKSHAAPPSPGSRRRTASWGTSVVASRVPWPYQPGALSTAVSAVLTSGDGSRPLDDVEALVNQAGVELANQPSPVRLRDTPRAPDAPKVFLSYRMGDDAAAFAAAMMDEAVAARYGRQAVFRAQGSLPPGASLPESLLTAARRAQVVLVLIGEDWERVTDPRGRRRIDNPTDYVVAEINAAANSDVLIVPVLVGNRGPLRAENLPQGLRHLALRQYLQLPRDLDREHVTTLIDRLLGASESRV